MNKHLPPPLPLFVSIAKQATNISNNALPKSSKSQHSVVQVGSRSSKKRRMEGIEEQEEKKKKKEKEKRYISRKKS